MEGLLGDRYCSKGVAVVLCAVGADLLFLYEGEYDEAMLFVVGLEIDGCIHDGWISLSGFAIRDCFIVGIVNISERLHLVGACDHHDGPSRFARLGVEEGVNHNRCIHSIS